MRMHTKIVCGALLVVLMSLPAWGQSAASSKSRVAVATPVASAKADGASADHRTARSKGKATTSRPLTVSVHLLGGEVLTGTLLDAVELPLRATFGHVQVPLSEVAGIKLAQEGNPVTTVVLHNGDVFTGATDLKKLLIKTEWGQADVTGPNVSSILFTNGVRWTSQSGFSGTQWKLVAMEKPSRPSRRANPATVSTRAPRPSPSITGRGRTTTRGTTRSRTR